MYKTILLLLIIPSIAFGQQTKIKKPKNGYMDLPATGKRVTLTKRSYIFPQKFSMADSKEVNAVVRAVILQQTVVRQYDASGKSITALPGVSHYSALDGMSLSVDLIKADNVLSDPSNKKLFDPTQQCHFDKADSLYFVYQNNNFTRFKVDTIYITNTQFTSIDKQKYTQKKGLFSPYYILTIPVFSADKKTAYVYLDYYSRYARGYGFFLKKTNSRWLVICQSLISMS